MQCLSDHPSCCSRLRLSQSLDIASALLDHTTENQTADYVRRKKARKTGAVR